MVQVRRLSYRTKMMAGHLQLSPDLVSTIAQVVCLSDRRDSADVWCSEESLHGLWKLYDELFIYCKPTFAPTRCGGDLGKDDLAVSLSYPSWCIGRRKKADRAVQPSIWGVWFVYKNYPVLYLFNFGLSILKTIMYCDNRVWPAGSWSWFKNKQI